MPDAAASALHSEGLLSDGDVTTMWSKITWKTRTARTMARDERAQTQLAAVEDKFARIAAMDEVQAFFDGFLCRQRKQIVPWILEYLARRYDAMIGAGKAQAS